MCKNCVNKGFLIEKHTALNYFQLGLIADPVIEAIGMPEFEDGLRKESSLEAAGAIVVSASSPVSVLKPSWGADLSY